MYEQGLFKVIKLFGSQSTLAKILGVSQQAVNHWLNREQRIPYLHAMNMVKLCQGLISLEELVPDQKDANQYLDSMRLGELCVTEKSIDAIQAYGQQCPLYTSFHTINQTAQEDDLNRPILIDEDCNLITCECRLRYKTLMNQKKIKTITLNTNEFLENIHLANFLLPYFPLSERVALGLFIEKTLGNRRGRRTDLKLPQNYAEVCLGNETRNIAAKLSGFGSHYSYAQAKWIVKNSTPELIKAMDERRIAISRASKIAHLYSLKNKY